MIESLAHIFDNLDLTWIDSSKEILTSQIYTDLLSIFPNLKGIFQEGENNDNDEFLRTIRHVIRAFKVFFLLKNGNFMHDSLSQNSLNTLRDKLKRIEEINEKFLPLIFMYHDIGRFFDKKDHPYQSHVVILNKELLDSFDLLDVEKLIIDKIIQYHLLFASIYTGEATYFGVYSILIDSEFVKLLSSEKYRELFVDLLEIFTYIDILGYSYAKIFDHYIKYFNEINRNLKQILKSWPDKNKALKKATDISQDWIEWRISGAMRIFQFVETKSYLTREFYFNKLRESVIEIKNEMIEGLEWEIIKKNYLTPSSQIQIKYGLGVLMILAFGNFFRSRMKKDSTISNKLAIFWILLSKEIGVRSKGDDLSLWNVYFINLPNLLKIGKEFANKIDIKTIEIIITNSTQEFDERRKEYSLLLDFKGVN
jgi:hypothetical protein